ncbi:MAG: ribonuclease R [Mycoplasmataceae bacterium]|nr:ribonuclease R [Mycoplasmataceae bacterium]
MLNQKELITYIQNNDQVTFIDIARYFSVSMNQNRDLTLFLNSLVKDVVIMQTVKKTFFIPHVVSRITAEIKINQKGFGFVEISEGKSAFVASSNIHGAMDSDQVEAVIFDDPIKKGSLIASVVKVVKRKNNFLFGTVKKTREYFDFIPLNSKINNRFRFSNKELLREDIFIKAEIQDINSNYIVLKIVKIIANINEPYADINLILESMEIDDSFNNDVLNESLKIPTSIENITEFNRVDLRENLIVTIDGESTKDFDDAINVEKLDNGNYKLGVYIADVAHYVKEDSAIDKQAFSRATSIYLIDKVIPMLPEALSNGICSLNPHVDRFVIAFESEVDKYGKQVSYKLFPAIINSKYRLTYTQVANYENEEMIKSDENLVKMLESSYKLSEILSRKKASEGYIDFEIEEPIISLDEKGATKSILIKRRKSSEILIENFMVYANENVSKIVSDLKVPSIYRIHESPSSEKIFLLQEIMNILKIKVTIPFSKKPLNFSQAVKEIKKTRFDDLIKISLLRTMQKAKYDSDNIGHFGLASEYYSHFTSPIRRYPDLVLHRIIWEIIFKKNTSYAKEMANKINLICSHSSKQEELAVSIERKIFDIKKSEFYESKIGKMEKGMIVSIKKFGIFVDFPDKVSCFVHVTNIPEGPYSLSNNGLQLYNDNKKYVIGDVVNVKIISISKLEGKVDGVIVSQ